MVVLLYESVTDRGGALVVIYLKLKSDPSFASSLKSFYEF